MATIIRKTKKGRPYYYAVESRRVDGKPRIVWQKYLGTLEAIVTRTQDAQPAAPKEAVLFEAGGVAALLRIAQQLDLVEFINRVVPKRNQGPSVGHYMLLAALNRALAPCSKVAIGDWYEATVLRRLWRWPKSVFSSQRFWDHMDLVSQDHIQAIEEALLRRVAKDFACDSDLLLYDSTNFFTFLATSNDRASLAQRGYAKSKRHDLRLVGLALLVTREFQIPLLHHTYAGNISDVSLFPEICLDLFSRYARVTGDHTTPTVVFDKGNVSEDAMEKLVVGNLHFVAALPARAEPELLGIPHEDLRPLAGMPGSQAWTTTADLWSKTCRVVVVYSDSFFTQQLAGVTRNLVKSQNRLAELQRALDRWQTGQIKRGKRPTVASVRRSIQRILSAQFMKELFTLEIEEEGGLPRLQYKIDREALDKLTHQRLGRTLLVTDQLDWQARRIVEAYRSLATVEESFKHMKNRDYLRWQPAYHWTDQKLRVHSFYCVLALLMVTLARQKAARANVRLSIPALLAQLNKIREVAVVYPPGTMAHRKDHVTLSRMSPTQRKLADCLEIGAVLAG